MIRFGLLLAVTLLSAVAARAQQPMPVRVVSAQPAVLDIARQIGGGTVSTALLSPGIASDLGPSIVMIEGGAFDSWAKPILTHLPKGATLLRAKPSDDSAEGFSWYDLDGTNRFAEALTAELTRRRPEKAAALSAALVRFRESLARLKASANKIADVYRESAVLVTDNRFSPILRMLRLRIVTADAGLPSVERAIRSRKGVILVHDSETKSGLPERVRNAAEEDGLPLVGLRETMPSGLHYQQWIARAMNTIQGALNEAAP